MVVELTAGAARAVRHRLWRLVVLVRYTHQRATAFPQPSWSLYRLGVVEAGLGLDDAAVAQDIAAIAARLRELAVEGHDAATIGPELGALRAHLRLLATQNAEVAARLGASLGFR